MSNENILAYAVKQKEIDYNAKNLILLQAQLINKNEDGHVMVEKVAKDTDSYAAGKYYIPGVAMQFGEHPEEKRDITGHDGKYGPYVKCGKVNASLLEDQTIENLSLEEAIKLIDDRKIKVSQKKAKNR